MDIRAKFLRREIPFDELDVEMIELIDVFNFDLGLKTMFCCYGHKNGEETCVVFDACVTDEQIIRLAEYLSKVEREIEVNGVSLVNDFGEFNKYVRNVNNCLEINWTYSFPKLVNKNDDSLYNAFKKKHMEGILEDLRGYKGLLADWSGANEN